MILTKSNYELYAARHYVNNLCLSRHEFEEDLAYADLARRMSRKIIKGSSVNIRLLCNHILCFTNNFEIIAAKNLLLIDTSEEEKQVLKTILNYLGMIAPGEMQTIRFHLRTAKLLKDMD